MKTKPARSFRQFLPLLPAAVLLTACATEEQARMAGLSLGSRYVWAKPGATEVERQRMMYVCGEADNQRMREGQMVAATPVLGLLAAPGLLPLEQEIMTNRVRCMEQEGWRLVDVVTGEPQSVTFGIMSAPRIVPASALPPAQ